MSARAGLPLHSLGPTASATGSAASTDKKSRRQTDDSIGGINFPRWVRVSAEKLSRVLWRTHGLLMFPRER